MFCKNCGQQIDDKAMFCPHCGAHCADSQPQPQPRPTYSNDLLVSKSNTLAIVGFVLAFFVPLAGLICSIIAYKRAVNDGYDSKSFAIAGIVLSAIELAVSLIVTVLLFIYMGVIFDIIMEEGMTCLAAL